MDKYKKIVIFGAGNFGKMAIEYYGYENVLCFVDNNSKKINTLFCRKPVISFDSLLKMQTDIRIIVATIAYKEIVEQLKDEGIENYGLYLPQYTKFLDSYMAKQGEGKNVILFGWHENLEILIEDFLNRGFNKNRVFLADTEGSKYIGKNNAGYEVKNFKEIKKSAEIIIITSKERTYALQAYVNREIQNKNCVVINPFIQTTYYSTEKLIFNPYGECYNDTTEQEWCESLETNSDRKALDEYVTELNKKVPLFEHVEIETINRCNGKCDFCPVSVTHDIREKHVMEKSLFKKIIDQLAELEYSGRLATFSNNEPFLDSRIIEFNRYARENLPKARLHLFTNGTIMNLEKFQEIIQYLDELIIDNYNQNLKLNKNSRDVKAYCEQHPELIKKVTIVTRKEHEILTSRGGDAPNRKQKESYPLIKCALPFKQLIIRPDGKVSLCCNDPYGRMTLGDVTQESLTEIWYGKKFSEVREKLSEGRGMLEHCKICDSFILF